ncbi:MAG: PVC-type heme-binding CxxCH protein [Luteolibacter sp.]|uniref:PVC-type heme-binding CxxCH protein n=1 Tax=Luteolibacter sp. TaxID=1962973 RepID=UPI0032648E85
MIKSLLIQAALTLGVVSLLPAAPVSLFDGKSFAGWEIRKGEEKWWKVEDGMITGGSLTETVPFNTFIASAKAYGDFDLSYKLRLVKGEGFMNSGMQIRSKRAEADSEMIGYQVDAGAGYWGDLYDESRRNVAMAKSDGTTAKDWEWNDYRVLCEGSRIRTWINGVVAVDFTEKDPGIAANGFLGLQAHGGGKFLVQLKDIFITELPSPGGVRSPETERASFKLPAGYSAELVASEEQGVGKPITVAWDKHGKMWTMTALEYPVDANENEAAARQLYQHGGKDRVLVFDEPNTAGPLTPRVFADGLAIPLGILPTDQGVYVQHGPEIRRYHDDDGDGEADGFDVVLEGFGFQDSHLFPHQFERAQGGWIYLAQGAFNYSKVRRPNGLKFDDGTTTVDFNNCKLARFRPDGSAFEPLTGGPNNIWGLVITRNGETFVQEANDLGYPVAEFAPGTHYPTGSGTKLRDDAPILTPSTPNEPMGGTGLSGLALAEDTDTPFAKGQGDGAVFYLANPITSKIQIVTMTRDVSGHPIYKKGADFMTTGDPWFRPISVHFGPDGCLYVVDWYNKIISHNEVPRTHPDRDKTRGRIWRIRHESQQPPPQIDLAKVPDKELIGQLAGDNALISSHVWQEIGDRKAVELTDPLQAMITDSSKPLQKRLGALWALEGLHTVRPPLLVKLAGSPEAEFRYEAVRIAGENSLGESDFLAVISALGNESHFRVRAAIANAVRQHRQPTPKIIACAAALGLEPAKGNDRAAYDRTFERYLARWAMSVHPEATKEMIATVPLTIEAKLLAVRSLDTTEAAAGMVKLLPDIKRPLASDELSLLGTQLSQPDVMRGFSELLGDPARCEPMLRSMLQFDAKTSTSATLAKAVELACTKLLDEQRTPDREHLVVQLARRFRLRSLSNEVNRWLKSPQRNNAELAEGLASLREIGAVDPQGFRTYLDHADDLVRREAIIGFASADDAVVVGEFSERWQSLTGSQRSLAVNGMTSSPLKATAFAKAMAAGKFQGFDGTAIEKLIAALGAGHPDVAAVLNANKGLLMPVLRFGNDGPGRIVTNTTLKGPFTVETWIKLPAPIDNNDGLLGKQGGPDINFYGAHLRVFGGDDVGDIISADREIKPDLWTHCAITRDAANRFKIYLDGEPDTAQGKEFAGDFTAFNLAETHRGRDTAASFDEVRVWKIARTSEEIRRDAQTRYSGGTTPAGLVMRITGDQPLEKPEGSAGITLTMDFPKLVSPAEALALDEKFTRFRAMTALQGDAANGKKLVQATCMMCHQIQGEGTSIGPNLSGAGAMGVEALLRNILTPNAQLESGYYRHDVKKRDGTVVSGFLASENEDSITLRIIGEDERVIPRAEVISHEVSRRSLMPEGLIDGFSERQVSDLFAYLKTLR